MKKNVKLWLGMGGHGAFVAPTRKFPAEDISVDQEMAPPRGERDRGLDQVAQSILTTID